MTVTGISSVINTNFIGLFSSSSSSSSSSGLSTSLRAGAQTFAAAVQTLNSTVSFLNTAKEKLEKIGKIADKVVAIGELASHRSTSSSTRAELAAELRRLGREYDRTLNEAKIGDYSVLSEEDLSGALDLVGLEQDRSDSIAAIFKKFKLSGRDDSLASEYMKGGRPVPIPAGAYTPGRNPQDCQELFDKERSLKSAADGYYLVSDAKAFKDQIKKNIKAIDYGMEVVQKNIDLVRGAGFAFLDESNQITSSDKAEEVAADLQQMIRQNAPAALSQAENLNPIVVATLSTMSKGFTYRK